jgi:predicted ATPase
VPYFLLGLALCHRAAGNLDAALTAIDDALAGSARHGERYLDAELHRVRGELLLQQGNQPQDAEADLRAAARIAAEQGGLLLELRAAASLYKAHPGRPTERVPLHGIIAALKSRGVEGADVSEAEALAAEGQM